jgi:PAS domain S-box-containing protein
VNAGSGRISGVTELTRLARLARHVVRHERMADLVAELHEHVVEAAGGSCSALLVLNARTGQFLPASASGVERLDPVPYLDTATERALVDRAFEEGQPHVVTDTASQAPSLAALLATPAAVIVPLSSAEGRLGLLLVGLRDLQSIDPARPALSMIGDLGVLALEHARLRRDAELRQGVRALVGDLSRSVSSALSLSAGLEVFCARACRLFVADVTSVWLHDRRARELWLGASSDPAAMATGQRVPADDPSVPASSAMRRERAEMIAADPGLERVSPTILVPLRGRRRALGTLVIEGARADASSELDLLDWADEVGRQLSAAIENVQLLEDVLRSRRELENTFNSLADLVVVCDTQLRVAHANRAFASRIGKDRHEAVDQPLAASVSAELAAWVGHVVAPTGDEPPQPETREFHESGLGGTFTVTVCPLLSPETDVVGAVVVARDITEQARLEAERLELRDRLTQSEKLAALGQFVAGIAHELNNPLQGVLGHVELLRASSDLTTAVRRDLRIVYREADRAARIVRNLLMFAGPRKIARRRVSLNRIVNRVMSLRGPSLRRHEIELTRDLADSLPYVTGDSHLLQQAILNIVVNAEQALSDARGPRRLGLRTWVDERRGVVGVQVSDNGPGVPAGALPRIFEPFFTTKEVGRGTGLGLAIAYGIVQEHAGRIHVTNRNGGGANFIVELPMAEKGTSTVN